jgi:hypothetical protein
LATERGFRREETTGAATFGFSADSPNPINKIDKSQKLKNTCMHKTETSTLKKNIIF